MVMIMMNGNWNGGGVEEDYDEVKTICQKKLGKQSWLSNILRFVASSLTLNEFQFAGLTCQKNSHDGLQPVTMVSWQCHGLVIKQFSS